MLFMVFHNGGYQYSDGGVYDDNYPYHDIYDGGYHLNHNSSTSEDEPGKHQYVPGEHLSSRGSNNSFIV